MKIMINLFGAKIRKVVLLSKDNFFKIFTSQLIVLK